MFACGLINYAMCKVGGKLVDLGVAFPLVAVRVCGGVVVGGRSGVETAAVWQAYLLSNWCSTRSTACLPPLESC